MPIDARQISALSGNKTDAAHEIFDALAVDIASAARAAIHSRQAFKLVVTGGDSVLPLYERLRLLDTDWAAWRIFWSDERCVPPTDAMRNSRRAREIWLDHVPVSETHLFPIPAELGPDEGARRYNQLLSMEADFDLVLLSLGEDGHVASLFPGHTEVLNSRLDAIAIHNAPKLPPQRVTLSLQRLLRTGALALVAIGRAKQRALEEFRLGTNPLSRGMAGATNLRIWSVAN